MPKTARMNLRLRDVADERIRQAAALSGASLSEFVEQAATQEADRVLADRTEFALSAQAWEAFVARLDEPARELPGMDRADAAWERHFGSDR